MDKSFQDKNMNRRYFLWMVLAALACLVLIIFSMWESGQPVKNPPPQEKLSPYYSHIPFKSYISAVGVVEASSDNISIGTSVNRIVNQVLVTAGSKVKKGDPLFQLEDQDLQADLHAREVAYKISQAKLQKLESLPRSEDVASAEAGLQKAQIELNEAQSQYERVQGLQDTRAISQQEINRRHFNAEQAKAQWKQAKANLDKIKEGTWQPDLDIAKLETIQAKANMEQMQTEIQRTIIRSPIDGVVLQVKIHEGELTSAVSAQGPLMIVGDTDELYLKVSVNQFEAPYFRPEAPAIAYLRGNARVEFPLEFIRLEPYLVNKQNFTNEITDKVDTRVLQVLYHITKANQNIFVGQQMDVFIEAEFPK
jgi:HlyD family secretion protein